MFRIFREEAKDLTVSEWETMKQAVAEGFSKEALSRLQKVGNTPTRACELFDDKLHINSGHERGNAQFNKAGLPYRLTRIGKHRGCNRADRLLAIVRWGQKTSDDVAEKI